MTLFNQLRESFVAGQLDFETNRVSHQSLSEFPEDQLRHLENLPADSLEKGKQILKSGQWARLVLNGGMATRFGGRVKGVCEVYEDKTFLELKIEHLSRLEKTLNVPEVPVVLMNSHATNEITTQYLEAHNYFGRKHLTSFIQRDFPRLSRSGDFFEASEGKERAPCGHGDFIEGLVESGTLSQWQARGVTHFDFSNIDNLGATVEADMIGAFVGSHKPMAVELARKNPGDKGGAACLKDGIKGVIEGIYFDAHFDQDRLPWFNTNNLMFSIAGLEELSEDQTFSLPWNVVQKEVNGEPVIQFERIAIDTVFGFNRTPSDDNVLFFGVPREEQRGRFYPVKSPKDLENLKETLKERLEGNCKAHKC